MYNNLRLITVKLLPFSIQLLKVLIEKYVEAFVIKFIMYPLFYKLTGILDVLRIKGK